MAEGSYTFDDQGRMTNPPEDALTEAAAVYSNGVSTYDTGSERTLLSTTVIQYSYVYNGGQLVQMTIDTTTDSETSSRDTLYFAYDASGTPMSVTYNETVYYYATNLQGDIVAILDTTGTAVVQYSYDAWGNPLSTTGTLASTLGEANPLRYRGYVYDTETELYYLQSRYYDPEIGRFINADAFVSTGQGLLGNNMFAYCLNNPVRCVDSDGRKAEDATDTEEDEEDTGYRIVGGGVQIDFDIGCATLGMEIILYWDSTVCGDGNWTVAFYTYNGACMSMDDPFVGAIIATMTENAALFDLSSESGVQEFIQFVCGIISDGYSVGVSGVVIVGNEQFESTKSYEGSFTSINADWRRVRGSYAYSNSCRAITFGLNAIGGSLLPRWGVSKTYYYLTGEITFPALF